MKKSLLFVSIIVFILMSMLAMGLNDRKTISQGETGDKAQRIESVSKKDIHKRPIPYRDDADYSEHGNDLFGGGDEFPVDSPYTHSVPHTGR